MSNKFFVHLGIVVVAIGGILYMAQNCGSDIEDARTSIAGNVSGEDQLGGDPIDPGDFEFNQYNLTLNLGSGDQVTGDQFNLLANEAVPPDSFAAELLCVGKKPVLITSSPVLISANRFCLISLKSLTFKNRGEFKTDRILRAEEIAPGARYTLQNDKEEKLLIEVVSQLNLSGETANANFSFYEIRRDNKVVQSDLKTISIEGQLAPEFDLKKVEFGTSNAGIVLEATFTCTGSFQPAKDQGTFRCGDYASSDLNLIYEPISETIDFDTLSATTPDSVDGPNGLIAQFGMFGFKVSQFPIQLREDGFSVIYVLPHVNDVLFAGVPQQVVLGVSTKGGASTSNITNLVIN